MKKLSLILLSLLTFLPLVASEPTMLTAPTTPTEARVCLWEKNRSMALTLTVDDNWSPDHAWWLEMGRKYGLKVTWFVITDNVKGGFGGTWADFQKLLEAGHDVQSHTRSHLGNPDYAVEEEYLGSLRAIEQNLPGHRVTVLAYPGGKNSERNSTEVAARFYLGARGTAGVLNSLDKTNYMQTNSLSGVIPWTPAECRWANVEDCLRKHGWMCVHYHGVNTPEKRTQQEKNFQKIHALENEIWVALFADVIRYARERDTAEIRIVGSSPLEIRFLLTDTLDDAHFDYPLTIQLRIPDDWKTVVATQTGQPIKSEIVREDGKNFAYLSCVPDGGEVITKVRQREK